MKFRIIIMLIITLFSNSLNLFSAAGIPDYFYLAEIDNQSPTAYSFAGNKNFINDLNTTATSAKGGVKTVIDSSITDWINFVGLSKYMKPTASRYAPANTTVKTDPSWYEFYFRNGSSILATNNSIILIPETPNETCSPVIFVGITSTKLGTQATSYLESKQITSQGTTLECCQYQTTGKACATDTQLSLSNITGFPNKDYSTAYAPAAKLKLTILKDGSISLTNLG